MIDHADAQAAIAAVRQSRSDLAILPLGDGEAWWRELDLEAAPRIIARLPFFVAEGRSGGEPAAIVSNPLDDPNAPEMMCYAATLAPTSDLGEAEFLARAPGGEVLFAVPAGTEAGDLPAGARPVGGYVRPLAIDGGKG